MRFFLIAISLLMVTGCDASNGRDDGGGCSGFDPAIPAMGLYVDAEFFLIVNQFGGGMLESADCSVLHGMFSPAIDSTDSIQTVQMLTGGEPVVLDGEFVCEGFVGTITIGRAAPASVELARLPIGDSGPCPSSP